jgi:hypothetical protein
MKEIRFPSFKGMMGFAGMSAYPSGESETNGCDDGPPAFRMKEEVTISILTALLLLGLTLEVLLPLDKYA